MRGLAGRCLAAAVLAAVGVSGCATAPTAGHRAVEVDFVNASSPTRCAEEDNVYVKVAGNGVTAFRLTAEHPPYIASVLIDSTAPDFTDCDMSNDPVFRFEPRTVTLYEDEHTRLVGHAFPTFWRPESVDFRVGTRVERGLHLVQLSRRALPGPDNKAHDIEILVLYPSDGYWRAKPLPPATLPDSAFGSSFLFGPVAMDGRPYVPIREVSFDPSDNGFSLLFGDGSRGRLTVTETSRERLVLSLSIDRPVAADRPFAALRSMFVTTAQSDIAVATWRPAAEDAPRAASILSFGAARATAARFGRIEPSAHNLSAPDMVFDRFGVDRPPVARIDRAQ
jgi:hypothetical protein